MQCLLLQTSSRWLPGMVSRYLGCHLLSQMRTVFCWVGKPNCVKVCITRGRGGISVNHRIRSCSLERDAVSLLGRAPCTSDGLFDCHLWYGHILSLELLRWKSHTVIFNSQITDCFSISTGRLFWSSPVCSSIPHRADSGRQVLDILGDDSLGLIWRPMVWRRHLKVRLSSALIALRRCFSSASFTVLFGFVVGSSPLGTGLPWLGMIT